MHEDVNPAGIRLGSTSSDLCQQRSAECTRACLSKIAILPLTHAGFDFGPTAFPHEGSIMLTNLPLAQQKDPQSPKVLVFPVSTHETK
jgi:hypothetical protein